MRNEVTDSGGGAVESPHGHPPVPQVLEDDRRMHAESGDQRVEVEQRVGGPVTQREGASGGERGAQGRGHPAVAAEGAEQRRLARRIDDEVRRGRGPGRDQAVKNEDRAAREQDAHPEPGRMIEHAADGRACIVTGGGRRDAGGGLRAVIDHSGTFQRGYPRVPVA